MEDRPLGITISVRTFHYINHPVLGEVWGIEQANCNIHTKAIIINPRNDSIDTLKELKAQMERALEEMRNSSSPAEPADG